MGTIDALTQEVTRAWSAWTIDKWRAWQLPGGGGYQHRPRLLLGKLLPLWEGSGKGSCSAHGCPEP